MQHKSSKRILKYPELSIPFLQRCFFLQLPHEAEDIAIPLQSETVKVDRILECKASTGNDGNAIKPLNSVNTNYECLESKEALLLVSLGDDEKDSVQLYQQNCFSLWKKLGSSQHKSANLERLSVDVEAVAMRVTSPIQGNNRAMLESDGTPEEEVSYGKIMSPPLSHSWRCFTHKEIIDATENFHPGSLVGKGGFGKVYKGTLSCGQVIAIKKFNQSDLVDHREKEFLVEIGIMAHVCHPNTTPLVGFCLEEGLYLIYNFYPNGSLAGILHGTKVKTLDWSSRYKVAVGTARGLLYLHKQCRRRIIHRDIKASNILLDDDFEPQISDFGLAKWLPEDWSHHSVSPVEGTFGCVARPESPKLKSLFWGMPLRQTDNGAGQQVGHAVDQLDQPPRT